MSQRLLMGFVAIALSAACGSDRPTPSTTPFAVRFSVFNQLVSPVTISVDGTPYVILSAGKSTTLTVPAGAQWLTWTSAKAAGSNGLAFPDDINEQKVAVSGISGTLEITNVINDQPYITAGIFNSTSAAVSIGVYDGATVTCGAELAAASGTVKGFTRIGYYRLLSTTEVRAYHSPTGCTGAFTAWPSTQLKAYEAKSGLLTLTLDAAP